MRTVSRRQFVNTSLAVGAGAALAAPAVHAASKAGKTYRTALIGTGWWGTNILREAIRSGQCQIVALCDVDKSQLDTCQSEVRSLTNDEPKGYSDFREGDVIESFGQQEITAI